MLQRSDDFVTAELRDSTTDERFSVPYRRSGLTVRFICAEGVDDLFVRHLTINTRQAGGPSDDGGGARPAP